MQSAHARWWLPILIATLLWGVAGLPAKADPIRVSPAENTVGVGKRAALVVGNGAYQRLAPVPRAVADASAIANALRTVGFETVFGENLDRRTLNDAIGRFLQLVEPGAEALVYFAGYGIDLNGANYLLPTDIPALAAGQERLLRSEALSLTEFLRDIEGRAPRAALIVLEASRENPMRRDGGRPLGAPRGLGAIEPPNGVFVLSAAGAGETALDSLGSGDRDSRSLFAREFLKLLGEEGIELRAFVRKLRSAVHEAARRAGYSQLPAYYDQLVADFAFRPARSPGGNAPGAAAPTVPSTAVTASPPTVASPRATPSHSTTAPTTDCDRVIDPRASREAVQAADVEAALRVCREAVERFPDEPRLQALLRAAEEQKAYRDALSSPLRITAHAYLTLYPNGRFADEMRTRIERLSLAAATPGPAAAPPAASPPASPLDPKELARALQAELARLGCDPGTPDGVWGAASQRAMALYNQATQARHDAQSPTTAALTELRQKQGRVCSAAAPPVPAARPPSHNCFTFNQKQVCE
jgi:hypothetical protein